MKRIVVPEWLDELPEQDSRAQRSRRDLRRVNYFMGNVRTVARELHPFVPNDRPARLVELGAGDGTLALRLAELLSGVIERTELILVDRQDLVRREVVGKFCERGWRARPVSADVFDFLPKMKRADCMFANLFLHHFDQEQLMRMLHLIAGKTDTFVACEPRRSWLGIFGTKLLPLIGCNAVTRHDATISVRAGFRGAELSALWPHSGSWKIAEYQAGWFSHVLVARRQEFSQSAVRGTGGRI